MPRLIDAVKLNAEFEGMKDGVDIIDLAFLVGVQAVIDSQPAIDAEPVVHAHWILLDDCSNAGVYCSACHKKCFTEKAWYGNVRQKSPRCPHCGAHMDEEVRDDKAN